MAHSSMSMAMVWWDWVRAFKSKSGTSYQYTWLNTGKGWRADTNYKLKDVMV